MLSERTTRMKFMEYFPQRQKRDYYGLLALSVDLKAVVVTSFLSDWEYEFSFTQSKKKAFQVSGMPPRPEEDPESHPPALAWRLIAAVPSKSCVGSCNDGYVEPLR